MIDSVSVRFKNASASKIAFKQIRIQWNAGTLRVGVRAKNASVSALLRTGLKEEQQHWS